MKVISSSQALKKELQKNAKKSVGFVPTMGYLHEGHLSLIRQAKKDNDIVVSSIFVNPLQFGPKEDFKKYPRDIKKDTALLKNEGTDILFVPKASEFYPPEFQTTVTVGKISQPLCGVTRPTHFAGVATVVLKLLNLVQPDKIYLGQKDYQQFRIVEQMIQDLSLPVGAVMMPIVREKDGLAMSSRNVYLSRVEREEAASLFRALKKGAEAIRRGERKAAKVIIAMKEVLKAAPHGRIDYLEVVDARSLEKAPDLRDNLEIVLLAAVYFGKTRLIDNLRIKV